MGKNGIMIFDGEKFISATTVEGNAIMKDLRKQDASQKPLEAH